MKAQRSFGSITIEVEGDAKEIFTELAAAQDVFGHLASGCGGCNCPDVFPVVREHEGNTYYEVRCGNCRCRLAFGQRRDGGTLFPRRKDRDGNWIPNNGWEDWKANQPAPANADPF